MSHEFSNGLATGFLSAGLIVIAFAAIPGSALDRYRDAIDACEAELPRNVKCVIYAKPEEQGE